MVVKGLAQITILLRVTRYMNVLCAARGAPCHPRVEFSFSGLPLFGRFLAPRRLRFNEVSGSPQGEATEGGN